MKSHYRVLDILLRLAAAAFLIAASGCATSKAPMPVLAEAPVKASSANVSSSKVSSSKVPVVLVPGITGAELIDRRTGKVIWGRGKNLISPKDGGYSLARPLADPLDGAANDVIAGDVLDIVKLGPVKQEIYGPLLAWLQKHGYSAGDLNSPTAQDELFAFGYDWRGDNIFTAAQLRQRLDALANLRGEGYAVDLICQSNGAHICRYLLKYGGEPLADAEAGKAAPSSRFRIRKMILVGTSNGGSMRILREIHRGRKYLKLIGRTIQPEVLFSFPSIFQDLPAHIERPFVDPSGRPLELSLFDADVWAQQGWSAFNAESAIRMSHRPDLFGNADDRKEYLRASLDRAQRLHRLLAADVPAFAAPAPQYYLLQNGFDFTPHLAVVGLGEDGLSFTGDPELERRPYLTSLVSRPGDGHASVESQMALSPQEREAIASPIFYVEDEHFELILNRASLRRLLDYLAD